MKLLRRTPLPPALMGLTGVWAFVESGLGGVMHALKLPFTGIWVGGTAVAVLIVMAGVLRGRYASWTNAPEQHSYSVGPTLLNATVLVMAVKFFASPHSPFTAYVAVGFQGLLAALLLSWFRPFRLGAVLFAIIAMLESALQKLLMMTLVYGAAWMDALAAMTESAARQFGWAANGLLLLWCYIALYAVWGLILGLWASGWAHRPPERLADLHQRWQSERQVEPLPTRKRRITSGWKQPLWVIAMLALVLTGLALGGADNSTLLWVALRSAFATALMLALAGPLRLWLGKQLAGRSTDPTAKTMWTDLGKQHAKFNLCWTFAATQGRHRWQRPFRAIAYFIHLDLLND